MNLGHSGTVGSKPGHAGAGQLNCFAVECLLSLTHPLFILSNYFLLTKVSEAPTTVHTQLSSTVLRVWKYGKSTFRFCHQVNIWSWSHRCFMTLFLSQLVTLTWGEATSSLNGWIKILSLAISPPLSCTRIDKHVRAWYFRLQFDGWLWIPKVLTGCVSLACAELWRKCLV